MYGTTLATPSPDVPPGSLPPFAAPLLAAYAAHLHGDVPLLLADVLEGMGGDCATAAGQCVHAVVEASQPLFVAGVGVSACGGEGLREREIIAVSFLCTCFHTHPHAPVCTILSNTFHA